MENIISKYLNYVRQNYAEGSCIIFHGYRQQEANVDLMTKASQQQRRQSVCKAPHFNLEPHTLITMSKDKFLSNDKNKYQLIKLLIQACRFEGYTVKEAEEGAETLIINTAYEMAKELKKTIVVVSQNIDLLVLLNQFHCDSQILYFLKVGAGKVSDCLYSSNSFENENDRSLVAFLHCFTGCDTTSGFAGKGKKTILNLLLKFPRLSELVGPFYKENADPKVISKNGCELIKILYKNKDDNISLNDLRFLQYKTLTMKSTFQLEKLPPTIGAAAQHSFRAYFQLQKWLGNKLNAKQWGWKEVRTLNKKKFFHRAIRKIK